MNRSVINFGIASLILLGNTLGAMAGLVNIDSEKNTAEQVIQSPQVVVYPEICAFESNHGMHLFGPTFKMRYFEGMYFNNNSNKIFLTPVIDIASMGLLSFNTTF